MSDEMPALDATSTTPDEHPEGDAIRARVERYFSDENLPHDPYMLGLTGGAENWPVSISRISGFYKMRQYKPLSLIKASLRKSRFLEFTDNKHIRRRVPLAIEPTVAPEMITEMQQLQLQEKTKGNPEKQNKQDKQDEQSKQEKPRLTKAMLEPTGFEENFADAPVTPAEHAINRDLYDPSISFATRMETAIQRYRARRKFHVDTARVFSEFLSFGGIDTTQKQFTGRLSKAELATMDPADVAAMTGVDVVREVVLNNDKWEVDFVGVAEGFLSSEMFMNIFEDNNPKSVRFFTNVLANFYRWLIHNDVCVEYNDQLRRAIATCTRANDELTRALELIYRIPDGFHTACSTFFGGFFDGIYQSGLDMPIGWGLEDAEGLVMAGISVHGTDEQFEAASSTSLRQIVRKEKVCLQIVTIEELTDKARELYGHSRLTNSKLVPLGKIQCRRLKHDLSGPLPQQSDSLETPLTFWIEEDVLDTCFIGMKMECEVCESNLGIKWPDRVTSINASYHHILPNEYYEKSSDDILPKEWYKRMRRIMQYGWQNKQELAAGTSNEGDVGDQGTIEPADESQAQYGADWTDENNDA